MFGRKYICNMYNWADFLKSCSLVQFTFTQGCLTKWHCNLFWCFFQWNLKAFIMLKFLEQHTLFGIIKSH